MLRSSVGWAKRSVPTISKSLSKGWHAALCPPYEDNPEASTMPQQLHIGDISSRTGRSVHTIRWYERQGLIPGVCRDGGGRRVYSDYHVGWLDLMERLR